MLNQLSHPGVPLNFNQTLLTKPFSLAKVANKRSSTHDDKEWERKIQKKDGTYKEETKHLEE